MENNEEYLNEEKYQKANKKVNKIGTTLLCIGLFMIILGITIIILANPVLKKPYFVGVGVIMIVVGLPFLGSAGQFKLLGNARNIQAYMIQQGMPIAQEGMEKMAPTAGVAAKEIAKGIKEGLKEDNMIFCKHCGETIDSDSTFCKRCGKQL